MTFAVVLIWFLAFAWAIDTHRRRRRNARYATGPALRRLNRED